MWRTDRRTESTDGRTPDDSKDRAYAQRRAVKMSGAPYNMKDSCTVSPTVCQRGRWMTTYLRCRTLANLCYYIIIIIIIIIMIVYYTEAAQFTQQ